MKRTDERMNERAVELFVLYLVCFCGHYGTQGACASDVWHGQLHQDVGL